VRVLINGAGIAGPTLAYWLRKAGHEVLLLEAAAQLRCGGYVVDFWGVGYEVAERMGLLPAIRSLGYSVREVRFVDARGSKSGGFSADVFRRLTDGRYISLRRSDLSAAIYAALDAGVQRRFGDSVAAIERQANGLCVRFERSKPCIADLVVGADGLHSRVRDLAFGPEETFEVYLGYHVAAFELTGYRPRDELVYVSHAVPGRQISRFAMREDRTLFLFVLRDEYLEGRSTSSEVQRREALRVAFADVGWECPQILGALDRVHDLYFEPVSQIRMNRWSNGSIALVGDAAACVSLLAGEGTGLAMAAAYVLAGELAGSQDDCAEALARYQAKLWPFLRRKQLSAAKFATSFVPRTQAGIVFRDVVTKAMHVSAVADYFIGRDLRDDLDLPDYAL